MRKRALVCLLAMVVVAAIAPSAHAGLAKISGKVTDPEGAPIDGACVAAFSRAVNGGYAYARSGASGAYLLDVPPGLYVIQFSDCTYPPRYATEWYDNVTDDGDAKVLVATAGQTKGINASLARLGSITGTVRAPDATALGQICVEARSVVGYDVALTLTADDGRYELRGLDAGAYIVRFSDCVRDFSIYATEWYDDARTPTDASPVNVGTGATTTGIDVTLDVGGSITGSMRDAGGDQVSGACVSAVHEDQLDSVGLYVPGSTYTITGLRPGRYKVEFWDCSGLDRYAVQWFDRARDYADASWVSVVLASETTDVDAAFEPA